MMGDVRSWATRPRWTVLEVGLGCAVGFARSWQRWRDDPKRPARLWHVGIEHTLPDAETVRTRLAQADIPEGLTTAIVSVWPLPMRGLHRLSLDGGRVVLVVSIGEPQALLPQLALEADAVWLHRHALEALDPRRLSATVRAACRKLSPDGQALTDSADPRVHDAMSAAGLALARSPTDAPTATWSGRRTHGAQGTHRTAPTDGSVTSSRDAIIVGAGLAGCALAHALGQRGWATTLVDAADDLALGGSGQPALAQHPSVTPDDSPLARLSRAALFLSRSTFANDAFRWIGRLQQMDADAAGVLASTVPARFARAVDAAEASHLAGLPLRRGGLWLPLAGCADPQALCRHWSVAATLRLGRGVTRLVRRDGAWCALDANGATIAEAPVAILAASGASLALVSPPEMDCGWPPRLQPRLGSTAILSVSGTAPRCVVGGDGHVVPLPDGRWLVGPVDDDGSNDRAAVLQAWSRVRGWLDPTGAHPCLQAPHPAGDTHLAGWRVGTPDHLPLAGPVPDARRLAARQADLRRDDRLPLPVMEGLWISAGFGGRGLLWAVLAAESIASRLDDEPPLLERDLLEAIDPRRFPKRWLRRML